MSHSHLSKSKSNRKSPSIASKSAAVEAKQSGELLLPPPTENRRKRRCGKCVCEYKRMKCFTLSSEWNVPQPAASRSCADWRSPESRSNRRTSVARNPCSTRLLLKYFNDVDRNNYKRVGFRDSGGRRESVCSQTDDFDSASAPCQTDFEENYSRGGGGGGGGGRGEARGGGTVGGAEECPGGYDSHGSVGYDTHGSGGYDSYASGGYDTHESGGYDSCGPTSAGCSQQDKLRDRIVRALENISGNVKNVYNAYSEDVNASVPPCLPGGGPGRGPGRDAVFSQAQRRGDDANLWQNVDRMDRRSSIDSSCLCLPPPGPN